MQGKGDGQILSVVFIHFNLRRVKRLLTGFFFSVFCLTADSQSVVPGSTVAPEPSSDKELGF